MNLKQDEYIKGLDKLINKFILRSKEFINCSAFPYGLLDALSYGQLNSKFTYDHEYFNFTKSTKTLISIRNLLKIGHNEDALILVRSIFENYLSTRYLNRNENKFPDLTLIALKLFSKEYIYDPANNIIKDRDGREIAERLNPSKFILGNDKKYYYRFYDLLSSVGHSNYGVSNFYLDETFNFTINKINYPLETRFFTIFVYTKLFEEIVTVEGEEFCDDNEEKYCYELVKESLLFQDHLLNEMIDDITYNITNSNESKDFNENLKKMFKEMRKSLREELGSIKKDFLIK